MKIEELPSGNYRVRKMLNGKAFQVTFDHKPTAKEALDAMSDASDSAPIKGSFHTCAENYIKSKSNVLSPSTIRGYESILRNLPESFTLKKLSIITQADIQTVVNEYAAEHSPKSTINAHGFIVGVLSLYRPSMRINTKLPQKAPKTGYIPTKNDIERILEASEGTKYHIAFSLGVMSLRLSEVCALTLDDIDVKNKLLTVNKALVKAADGSYVLKVPKTEAGARTLFVPDKLINEIMESGAVYDGYPNQCLKNLHKYQDELGIPRFRFHDLRHFYASYAHSQGVSDANIMKTGGWHSDTVMKQIYRHELEQKASQEKVFNDLLS